MIGLLQRVSSASVRVDGELTGAIDRGLLVLVGIEKPDDEAAAERGLPRGKDEAWVVVDADPALGWVRSDPVRLRQALFNLLSNAVKFTPPGGRVRSLKKSYNSRIS